MFLFGKSRKQGANAVSTEKKTEEKNVGKKITFPDGIYEGDCRPGTSLPEGIGKYIWNNKQIYEGEWLNGQKHGHGKFYFDESSFCEGHFVDGKLIGQGIYQDEKKSYEGNWNDSQFHGHGKLTFNNGDIYTGEFENDLRHGLGIMKYGNGGDTYVGMWSEGRKDGIGKMFYADGTVFEGQWKEDRKLEEGSWDYDNTIKQEHISRECARHQNILLRSNHKEIVSLSNADKTQEYSGEVFANTNIRHGRGKIYTHKNDTTYEGSFAFNLEEGYGVLIGKYNTYEGNWVNGMKSGQGRITSSDGMVCEGQFKENKLHGRAISSCVADGRYCEGTYENGLKQGHFVEKFADGSSFSGEYVKDSRYGHGIETDNKGNVFEGLWADNMMHGLGTVKYINGDSYVGEFVRDKKHGQGVFTYANGDVFEGKFVLGEPDKFNGKMTLANGQVQSGMWGALKKTNKGVNMVEPAVKATVEPITVTDATIKPEKSTATLLTVDKAALLPLPPASDKNKAQTDSNTKPHTQKQEPVGGLIAKDKVNSRSVPTPTATKQPTLVIPNSSDNSSALPSNNSSNSNSSKNSHDNQSNNSNNISNDASTAAVFAQIATLQPQLTALSQHGSQFMSLASASPQTINYLKSLGDTGVIAEQQYAYIRSDPLLHEYYIAFNQAVSSAVLACQSIQSGMVADSRVSKGEQIMSYIDMAANASGLPGVSIATGICGFLLQLPNDTLRVKSVSRTVTAFPSIDSHKYIEILSRELTILQQDEIRSVGTSESVRRTLWEKTKRMVEWLQTLDNVTPVQSYASTHASALLDKLMSFDPACTVQLGDITRLVVWSTGEKKVGNQLNNIRQGVWNSNATTVTSTGIVQQTTVQTNNVSYASQHSTTAVHSVVHTTAQVTVQNITATTTSATTSFASSSETDSLKSETDSLKAELAAMRERERLRDDEMAALRAESEKHKRITAALQKDVGKLSPKDTSSIGSGGLAQAMEPQPTTSANTQSSPLSDVVHRTVDQVAHANVAIGSIISDLQDKDAIIAAMAERLAALENRK